MAEPSAGLAPRIAADLIRTLATLHSEGMDLLLVEQFVRQALRDPVPSLRAR